MNFTNATFTDDVALGSTGSNIVEENNKQQEATVYVGTKQWDEKLIEKNSTDVNSSARKICL